MYIFTEHSKMIYKSLSMDFNYYCIVEHWNISSDCHTPVSHLVKLILILFSLCNNRLVDAVCASDTVHHALILKLYILKLLNTFKRYFHLMFSFSIILSFMSATLPLPFFQKIENKRDRKNVTLLIAFTAMIVPFDAPKNGIFIEMSKWIAGNLMTFMKVCESYAH